jgi:hypothetical protein
MAEIQKHWVKNADGWVSAMTTGSAYAADHYLRQFKDITVDSVQSYDLSDSDKMNGYEWAGEVDFKQVPCREAGDTGIVLEGIANVTVNRQPGAWSQWIDFTPMPVKVQKVKGAWQVNGDTLLLRGAVPTPADFAHAGVK